MFLTLPFKSTFSSTDKNFVGQVVEIKEKEESLQILLQTGKEKIIGFYDGKKDLDLSFHDTVLVTGVIEPLSRARNFYLFDYQKYGKSKNMYFQIEIDSIQILKKNKNIFYKIRTFLQKRIDSFSSNDYLLAMILGDSSKISEQAMESYRKNGISHLFSISGMHVLFLAGFISKLLEKMKLPFFLEILLFFLFFLFYSFLVGFGASVLRSSFSFLFFRIKDQKKLNLSSISLFALLFFSFLLIHPAYFIDIGFQYSFLISFTLLLFSKMIQKQKNALFKVLMISYLATVASLPISVYYFHQISLLTPIFNLLFVPFFSFFLFPLSFLTFFFPILDSFYQFLVLIFENLSIFLSQFAFVLIMKAPAVFEFCFLGFLSFFTLFLFGRNKKIHWLFFLLGCFFYHQGNVLFPENYVVLFDVGQGDSVLLHSGGKNILIDTGGSLYQDIAENVLIPSFQARGITKIDVLVLTHGDFDHMGAAESLVNSFPVDRVIFNMDSYNPLEKNLICVLEQKKIPTFQGLKEFQSGAYHIQFLNTRIYDNENDNSNVLYFCYHHLQFLFMGDAGYLREKEILEKYSLSNIDFLKVGHHGSDTSSSKGFIDQIQPKNSLISVGENNRYGHPKKQVLQILSSSHIYRTDQDGSIEIHLFKNGYKIKTCMS